MNLCPEAAGQRRRIVRAGRSGEWLAQDAGPRLGCGSRRRCICWGRSGRIWSRSRGRCRHRRRDRCCRLQRRSRPIARRFLASAGNVIAAARRQVVAPSAGITVVVEAGLVAHGRGAPAVDDRIDHVAIRRCPRHAGVAAGLAGRPQRHRQFAELHAGRQRHAGAEREHLAGAERGNEGQHAGAGVRHRRADQRLVAVVGQPHDEQRAALGDDVGIDLGRALRH